MESSYLFSQGRRKGGGNGHITPTVVQKGGVGGGKKGGVEGGKLNKSYYLFRYIYNVYLFHLWKINIDQISVSGKY